MKYRGHKTPLTPIQHRHLSGAVRELVQSNRTHQVILVRIYVQIHR